VKPQIKQERFSKVNGRPTSFTLSVRYTLRFDRPILDTLWWWLKIQYETNLDMWRANQLKYSSLKLSKTCNRVRVTYINLVIDEKLPGAMRTTYVRRLPMARIHDKPPTQLNLRQQPQTAEFKH
jgi:hypothetical protein